MSGRPLLKFTRNNVHRVHEFKCTCLRVMVRRGSVIVDYNTPVMNLASSSKSLPVVSFHAALSESGSIIVRRRWKSEGESTVAGGAGCEEGERRTREAEREGGRGERERTEGVWSPGELPDVFASAQHAWTDCVEARPAIS